MKIMDYFVNLETEFVMNWGFFGKMNGSPLYYNSTVFSLFHVKTNKFLSFSYDSHHMMRFLFEY